MILILSNPQDEHVKPVTDELARRGEAFRLYDPASYPTSSVGTLEYAGGAVNAHLSWDGTELDLDDVKSVWLRRPGDFGLSERLLVEERKWVHFECSQFFRAFWEGARALWVSRPDAIRRASLKGLQLMCAQEIGFLIPQYVITNEVAKAEEFIRLHPAGVVVKGLGLPYVVSEGKLATIFTHLVEKDDLKHLESVRNGPTFLQQFVQKTMDIRVTIIGRELFAIAIHSTILDDSRVDFRRAEIYDLPHSVIQLPEQIRFRCFELVARLGLVFGAIDLVLTSDEKFYFLEINPNGQWYWLQWTTGAPLTEALCNLLIDAGHR